MFLFILIAYIIAFGCWIRFSSFFSTINLSRPFIFFIFVTKIGVGLLYGLIHQNYFRGGDTFLYFNEAVLISETFFEYPTYYIYSLLGWSVQVPDAVIFTYPDAAVFWKSLGTYSIVHFHAIINYLAFSQYELHIFFVAIFGLYASLNFYKVFDKILALPKIVLVIGCFGLPSLTFWTSGLHKEVYIYFGLSIFVSALLALQEQKKSTHLHWMSLFGSLIIIGLTRHYLLALLLPAVIGYCWTLYYPQRTWLTYATVYLGSTLLAGLILYMVVDIQLFELLANQQSLFLNEKGGSDIRMEPFAPTAGGLLGILPLAIINVICRPFLWECKDFLQVLASIEIIGFLCLAIVSFALRKTNKAASNPLIHFILAYTISNLLLIGILVANVGTIVRYRSIAIGLVSILLTQIIDYYKLGFFQSNPPTKKRITPNTNIATSKHETLSEEATIL